MDIFQRELSLILEEAMKPGAWRWDVDLDLCVGDRRLATLFDVDHDILRRGVSVGRLLNKVHPEDRRYVTDALEASVEMNTDYEATYRLVTAASQRWIHARGRCFQIGSSKNVLHAGVVIDISAFVRNPDPSLGVTDTGMRLDLIAHHCLSAHRLASEAGFQSITTLIRPLLEEVGMRIGRLPN